MRKQHREILSINHEFLVNEMPMTEVLDAIKTRNILTSHDVDQLRTLRHQGRKALARYFLGVLPNRGPDAFQALLDSLQDANAQHLVDLLLQQAQNIVVKDGEEDKPPATPSDSPLPTGPDPHEYVVRLTRNNKLIRRFVEPAKISPILTQNKVMTPREADMVTHLHGKNKKWDLIFAVLLQRGERAYQAFMAALLKNEYSTVFHTIQDTSTRRSRSDESDSEQPTAADEDAKEGDGGDTVDGVGGVGGVGGDDEDDEGGGDEVDDDDDDDTGGGRGEKEEEEEEDDDDDYDNNYDELLDSDEEIKAELNQNMSDDKEDDPRYI